METAKNTINAKNAASVPTYVRPNADPVVRLIPRVPNEVTMPSARMNVTYGHRVDSCARRLRRSAVSRSVVPLPG